MIVLPSRHKICPWPSPSCSSSLISSGSFFPFITHQRPLHRLRFRPCRAAQKSLCLARSHILHRSRLGSHSLSVHERISCRLGGGGPQSLGLTEFRRSSSSRSSATLPTFHGRVGRAQKQDRLEPEHRHWFESANRSSSSHLCSSLPPSCLAILCTSSFLSRNRRSLAGRLDRRLHQRRWPMQLSPSVQLLSAYLIIAHSLFLSARACHTCRTESPAPRALPQSAKPARAKWAKSHAAKVHSR